MIQNKMAPTLWLGPSINFTEERSSIIHLIPPDTSLQCYTLVNGYFKYAMELPDRPERVLFRHIVPVLKIVHWYPYALR